jgi:hypothetical protein
MVVDFPEISNNPICVDADIVWQRASNDLEEECNYLAGVVFRRISAGNKKDLVEYVHVNHPKEFRERLWEGIN